MRKGGKNCYNGLHLAQNHPECQNAIITQYARLRKIIISFIAGGGCQNNVL